MLNKLIIILSIVVAMLSLPVMAGHGSKDSHKGSKNHHGSKKKGSKNSHGSKDKGSKGSKGSHGSNGVDDTQNCAVCDGKIDTLSLQYLGEKSVTVEIKSKKGLEIFTQNISPNDIFTLDGFDKKGTLGTKIFIYIDGVLNTQIHTSCSVPILIGMEFGDFIIRDGSSRNGGEICMVDGYKPVGHLCGIVYEDMNLNGIYDLQELAKSGIGMHITNNIGEVTYVETNNSGHYCSYNLLEGNVTVSVDESTLPMGTLLVSGENPNRVNIIENRVVDAGLDGYAYAKPNVWDSNITTMEDIPLSFILESEDKSGRVVEYILLSQPQNGILSATAPNLIYTPNKDYNGNDSFTFKVNNGILDSEIATVYITVTPVNDVPVANDDNITTLENETVVITPLLNDSDSDGDKLSLVSVGVPLYGNVIISGDTIYYAPYTNQEVVDSFFYTISDGHGGEVNATIWVHVLAVNDMPIVQNKTIYLLEDQRVSFELNASDPDGDLLTYMIDINPENGVISAVSRDMTYRPNRDFTGKDYLIYHVNDGTVDSYWGMIEFIVTPVNDPPIADAGVDVNTISGDMVIFDASGSYDIDGTIVEYEWREGNITLSTQKVFEYTFYEKSERLIVLTVTDNEGATNSDEKIITITPCCEGCIYPDPTQTNPYN